MAARPYRLFSGIAYPVLLQGDNPTKTIHADLSNRQAVYHDPAVKLSEADLARIGELEGTPICFEHDQDIVVGEIQRAWCDSSDRKKLRINAKVYTDTKCGELAWESLQNGKLAQLSVGYNSATETVPGQRPVVTGKVFQEVSLVNRGFFPGAEVKVHASATSSSPVIYFALETMATNAPTPMQSAPPTTPTQNNNPAPSQPLQQSQAPDNTPQELLKQTDVLMQEITRLRKEKEALATPSQEQLAKDQLYKEMLEERKQRAIAFEQQGLAKMQEVMAAQEAVLGKPLTKEYVDAMRPIFTTASFAEFANNMATVTLNNLAEKKRADELHLRASQMEEQVKSLQSNESRAIDSLKNTHSAILGLQQGAVATTASSSPVGTVQGLTSVAAALGQVYKVSVPNFSADEMEMLRQEGLPALRLARPANGVDVTASASGTAGGATVQVAAMSHDPAIQAVTQNSLARRWAQTAPMWSWAMKNSTDQLQVKLHSMPDNEERRRPDEQMDFSFATKQ